MVDISETPWSSSNKEDQLEFGIDLREVGNERGFPRLQFSLSAVCNWLTNHPHKQAKASRPLGLSGPEEVFGSNVTPWPDYPPLVKERDGKNSPGYITFQWLTFFIFFLSFLFIFIGHMACGISVFQLGIETMAPALASQNLNHWTAREVPSLTSSLNKENNSILKHRVVE